MTSFKTPKGTELPLLDLRGKQYLQVAHRLVWFREDHADWSIETVPVTLDDTKAIFKASIRDSYGRVISEATKSETPQGFADYIEKAETGAIGRALALCGYGTQFAPELEEGDRLADAPVTPGPTRQAVPSRPAKAMTAEHAKTIGNKDAPATLKQQDLIANLFIQKKVSPEDYLHGAPIEGLTKGEASGLIEKLMSLHAPVRHDEPLPEAPEEEALPEELQS